MVSLQALRSLKPWTLSFNFRSRDSGELHPPMGLSSRILTSMRLSQLRELVCWGISARENLIADFICAHAKTLKMLSLAEITTVHGLERPLNSL